jgi:hypothetical protein
MTTVYYPKIPSADYDTLRGVLHPDLPDTYDEWFDLARKQMRQIILAGNDPVEVEIYPHQFTMYCHAGRHARTLDRLKQFATEKGG